MNIELILRGQELKANAPLLAEQTIRKLFCTIEADSEWDGLAIRLVFRNINALGQIARSAEVTDRSRVEVPAECIRAGFLFINAIGVSDGGNVRLTTADMPVGLRINSVAAVDAEAANPVKPNEYDALLSLIGDLSSIPLSDTSSVASMIELILARIGDVSKLDADDIVSAISELYDAANSAKVPIAKGIYSDGNEYSASGELPEVASGSNGKHVGKGVQIVFIPGRENQSQAPTLKLNDGEAIEIRVRAAKNQSDNDQSPEATTAVPSGALMCGVPYTMTFCGKYWLIDSYIPLAVTDKSLTKEGVAADAESVGKELDVVRSIAKKAERIATDARSILETSITLGKHTDGLIYVFVGGKPVGNGLNIDGTIEITPVYGSPVVDSAIVSIHKGQTVQLGVKLDKEPTQNQTITVLSESAALTFDKTNLTFTPDNWNVMQFIAITCGDIDEDATATIVLQNSDELLTDTNITVYLTADGYAVDTTIPTEGQHVVTLDDFGSTSTFNGYIRLYNYTGEYDNIVIPSELDGKIPWICIDNATFVADDSHTKLKYVTFADGVVYKSAGDTGSKSDASGLFNGQTELIGVSNMNPNTTKLNGAFKNCTNLRFIDNISDLVNVVSMDNAFASSGIEYLPDLSAMNAVTNMSAAFESSSIKRVYGMPTPSTTCNTLRLFNNCKFLEKADIPINANSLQFAFNGCTSLRSVNVYATSITSVSSAFDGCSGVTVYAVADSTTYETLMSKFSGSTNVTIATLGSGETLPVIAVWGDSTSSPGRSWKEWPARLQEVVKTYSVKNQAVSGETTISTSARQGGNALSVSEFTIPADTTPVEISLSTADGHTLGAGTFSAGGGFNPCTIEGVQGTITQDGKFARKTPGDVVRVNMGAAVTSDADDMLNNADAVMLVNIGINAGWGENPDTLLNQVQLMVNHFVAKGGTKYIITGPYAGYHLRSEGYRQKVFEYETKAASAFGEHWLNLRESLIANGLTENGLTASAMDTERMALGQIPASLLGGGSTTSIPIYNGTTVTDDTHPNAYGQNSIFNAFYTKGQALGYWE